MSRQQAPHENATPSQIATELLLLDETARALTVLDGECAAIVYKGAAVARLLYHAGERSMTDADLLVAPRDFARARRALMAKGWRMISHGPGRRLSGRLHRAATLEGRWGITMDLHAHVAPAVRWAVDVDGLISRAVPFQLGTRSALRPSNEDLVLLAALNDAKDEHASLTQGTEDVARAIAGLPIDWPALVERARAWRATVALWMTLERASSRFGAAVPAFVSHALAPRRAAMLHALYDCSAAQPLRVSVPRRVRQALLGPLLTDSVSRFAAASLGFGAVRIVDFILAGGER